MATLHDLYHDGTLERFEPNLDPNQQSLRVAYMDPAANNWCFNSTELGEPTPNPHSYARVRAILDEFCAGALILEGLHIRQIGGKKRNFWEIKTVPERYSVRIFGWFHIPRFFIVACCKYKNDVSKRCKNEISFIEQYIADLPLDEPKVAKENTYEKLVSV